MSTPGRSDHRVRAHDRLMADGTRVRVGAHRRVTFSSNRARTNMQRAAIVYRRNKGLAWRLAGYAVAEAGAYVVMRGTGAALAALGVLLVEGGLAVRRRTSRRIPAPRTPGWNIPLAAKLREAREDTRTDHSIDPPQGRSRGRTRPMSPQQRREDARVRRIRAEQLARERTAEAEQREALRAQHAAEDARAAPGHPGGRWPTNRAEWEATPEDHPHKAEAMAFYRRQGDDYTGPVQWKPGQMTSEDGDTA